MTEEGHEDRFRRPRLNARCRFGQETLPGTHGNGRHSLKAAILAFRRLPPDANGASFHIDPGEQFHELQL